MAFEGDESVNSWVESVRPYWAYLCDLTLDGPLALLFWIYLLALNIKVIAKTICNWWSVKISLLFAWQAHTDQ